MNKKITIFTLTLVLLIVSALTFVLIVINDDSAKGSKPMHYLSNTSFVEDTDIFTQDREEWDYINKYYAKYPKTENISNFQSLATQKFNNINGKTVTVDTLYRHYKEALNDPNYSFGILLYQTILYKIANSEEEVSVSFTSFRTSITAAVCLNPNSPYYGYMRSLYDSDYDQNGFVRISYLFVEAAKMGIEVTIVGHLPSYAVKQYNNETNKTYSAPEPSYINYFESCLNYDCYSSYAEGKKVKDFMHFDYVKWPRNDKSATDVMHVKSLAVSHYLDNDGKKHENTVWFSSTNLDANNYQGYNGNGGSQSGMIISDHKKIFDVTRNYVNLLSQYTAQEAVYEFRDLVVKRNTKQIEMILNGEEELIPEGEQIVYLGSETDNIFEVYFTPFGGDADAWDIINNPYCKFLQKFYDSDDYVVFNFNNANYDEDFFVAQTLEDILRKKFVEEADIKNRLGIRSRYSLFDGFDSLVEGKNIGFKLISGDWEAVHEKDIMMSYAENGERQYVTFHSSCNFNLGALFYQCNQIVVVKETLETGTVVFNSLGNAQTEGNIVEMGQEFSSNERLQMETKLSSFPQTFEAVFNIEKTEDEIESYGSLFSNNDFWNYSLMYRINKNANPELIFGIPVPNSNGIKVFKQYKYTFDEIDVCTGENIHLTITSDLTNKTLSCYINGKLKQTIENVDKLGEDYLSYNTFVVGGDHLGSNHEYFRGAMYSLSAWSDIRSASEISNDYSKTISFTDANLLCSYVFKDQVRNAYCDDKSNNDNDLKEIDLWLYKTEVEEVNDYAYSFAVIGDTQALSWFHPEGLNKTYDWLVANKEKHNIQYVIGLGDITEMSYESEWEYATEQIYKLDGVVPYSVIMGNHDKYEFRKNEYMPTEGNEFYFNKYFYDERYLDELDGWYADKDVSCSYNAFAIGETKWLLINLDYGPTDEMLAWAADVIEEYSDHKVVIATHAYLYRDGSTLDKDECYPASGDNDNFNDGDNIWDELISKYENISLVLSGHDPWDHIVCTQTQGEKGNNVTQLLINPQYMDKYYGETDMVALLYFSSDGKTMTVRYYSIANDMYGSELSQFTVTID